MKYNIKLFYEILLVVIFLSLASHAYASEIIKEDLQDSADGKEEFTSEEIDKLDNSPRIELTTNDVVLHNGKTVAEFCKKIPDKEYMKKDFDTLIKECADK